MSVIDRSRTFVNEVVVETRKITWTSREDLRESTMVVIVSVAILSVILGIADKAIGIILQQILKFML